MNINDSVLQNNEKIIFALRGLYASRGYRRYTMSKFEEYDLYARNKDFLVSDNVITFTDTNGKLMALKPDVTLSIIKNSPDLPQLTQKVFYSENVYRVSKSTDSFKEIMQTGVECFGTVGYDEITDVITLAADSLALLSENSVLNLSSLSVIGELLSRADITEKQKAAVYVALEEKNVPGIRTLLGDTDVSDALSFCATLKGTVKEALPVLEEKLGFLKDTSAFGEFTDVLRLLSKTEASSRLFVNFSVGGDVNYYNGIIFKGYVNGIPEAVLSGGQYDKLMQKLARKAKTIGFAVYTDRLERLDLSDDAKAEEPADGFINIALPKGRLGEKVYAVFAEAGYECPALLEPNRKLIFENEEKKVRYFWVKPSDVAIYVERGAADIGVCGKDILMEYEPDVYELLDLNAGKCRMAVAGPKDFSDDEETTLRVATKFPNIAKEYYRSKGRDIDIIKLNGSIEIAPILGLSDVIVDIVETGTTLRENDLCVVEEIAPISARLIANKVSYNFKSEEIGRMEQAVSTIVGGSVK